ncbi:hypothetical protein RQP46_009540 [Phenoliferia psychrophenolica]
MIPQLYLLAVPMMAASLAEAHGPHMEKRHWPIPFFPDPFAHKESAPAPVYSTFTSYDNAQGASTATQYANAKGPATVTQYAQDASFSRPDATMGDFMKFNQTVWDRTMSFNKPGATTWTTRSMLDAHYARLQDAKKDSPDTVYGPRQALFEYLEMSVTSQLLGDWWFGNPRLDWVEILFKEERLPYKEGWRAHPIVVDWEGVWAQMLAMAAMSPNPIEEVGYLTTSTMSSLVKGTQFGPILACVMGLPGCDGSSKKLI